MSANNGKTEKPPKNTTGKTIVTPQGKIRPNNRKPFRKGTVKQVNEIIEFVVMMLSRRASTTQIHKAVKAKYDKHWRTCDEIYIVRANEIMRKNAQMPPESMRQIGINLHLNDLTNPNPIVRHRSEQRLSEIFGYNAPKSHTMTTPVGQPFQTQDVTEMPPMTKERMQEVLSWLAEEDGKGAERNGHNEMKKERNGA